MNSSSANKLNSSERRSSSTSNQIFSSHSVQILNEQQSDNSSLYSVDLNEEGEYRFCEDFDLGFGSLTSSEQAQITQCQDINRNEIKELGQEITKLKCDKLDLLRHNVVIFN
jgi:hypothetical protein